MDKDKAYDCKICGCVVSDPETLGPVGSKFNYLMRDGEWAFRMYDVTGSHHLNGSTTNVKVLVAHGIPITDIPLVEVRRELKNMDKFLKEIL